jgi:hypothetical protein
MRSRIIAPLVVLGVIIGGAAIYGALNTDLYSSSLTGNVSDWPSGNGCSPEADGYHITASIACYPDAADADDAKLSVTVKQLSGDQQSFYGIVFRRTSTGNNYLFGIDGSGHWSFDKFASSNPTPIVDATPNSAIKPGIGLTNKLEVDAKGTHFDFFVNGTKVGQSDDATYSSGRFGLLGDDNVEVVYTDFKATKG